MNSLTKCLRRKVRNSGRHIHLRVIMGSGIAQSFASNDFKVLLHDISDDMLSKAFNTINKSLDRMINNRKELLNEYKT